jgi:hypothetical protein
MLVLSLIDKSKKVTIDLIFILLYCFKMSELAPDELHLRGRMQIETALGALAYTGINLEAQKRLQTFLNVHTQLSDGQSQQDLAIYLQGEVIETEKADIIASLDTLCKDEAVANEMRLAAQALREII